MYKNIILRLSMVNFNELLKNPSLLIGVLISFILLLVPTSIEIYLQALAEYANESGYEFIGNAILFFIGLINKLTTWIVLTFIEPVAYLIISTFLLFSVLVFFAQIFKFK